MSIEINGMAHVILTVSDFPAARAFYGKLLSLMGMTAVCDTDKFFLLRWRPHRDWHRTLRPGTPSRTLCPDPCRTTPSCAFAPAPARMSTPVPRRYRT